MHKINQGMFESSLQDRVIQMNFERLVKGTRSNREQIANLCYTKGLISRVLIGSKMTDIIQTVQDKITSDRTGTPFRHFLEILNDDSSTEHLAEMLREDLEEIKKQIHEDYRKPASHHRSSMVLNPILSSQKTLHHSHKASLVCSPHSPLTGNQPMYMPSYLPSLSSHGPDNGHASYGLHTQDTSEGSTEEDSSSDCSSEDNSTPARLGSSGTETHGEKTHQHNGDSVGIHPPKSTIDTPGSAHSSNPKKNSDLYPSINEKEIDAIGEKIAKWKLDQHTVEGNDACCSHVSEIDSLLERLKTLQAEKMGESVLGRATLKAKLRDMKRQNKKQARKVEKLERRLKELASQEKENESLKKRLHEMSLRMQYMEAYCNEARADKLSIQAELVSARGELMQHRERESASKEKLASLEKKISSGYQSRIEVERLRNRAQTLENLLWQSESLRHQGSGGSFDEVDGLDTGNGGLGEGVDYLSKNGNSEECGGDGGGYDVADGGSTRQSCDTGQRSKLTRSSSV